MNEQWIYSKKSRFTSTGLSNPQSNRNSAIYWKENTCSKNESKCYSFGEFHSDDRLNNHLYNGFELAIVIWIIISYKKLWFYIIKNKRTPVSLNWIEHVSQHMIPMECWQQVQKKSGWQLVYLIMMRKTSLNLHRNFIRFHKNDSELFRSVDWIKCPSIEKR